MRNPQFAGWFMSWKNMENPTKSCPNGFPDDPCRSGPSNQQRCQSTRWTQVLRAGSSGHSGTGSGNHGPTTTNGRKIPEVNGGFMGKITDFYGPFSLFFGMINCESLTFCCWNLIAAAATHLMHMPLFFKQKTWCTTRWSCTLTLDTWMFTLFTTDLKQEAI